MLKRLQLLYNQYVKYTDSKFNLLIVGAQKCGTTSLHYALGQHPDIFMTHPIKEPGYFLPFENMQRYYGHKGLVLKNKEQYFQKYLLRGYSGERFFGESSTFYTMKKWAKPEIVQKMKDYNPRIKIIYLYRDRADRIISHFFHERYKNKKLTFENFLKREEAFGISLYAERIKPYLEVFGKDNILIIQFEKLITQPEQELRRVFNFLDLNISKKCLQFPNLNKKRINKGFDKQSLMQIIREDKRFEQLQKDEELFSKIVF